MPGRSVKGTGRTLSQVRARDGEDVAREAERFTDLYRRQHQRIFDFACRRVGPEVALEIVSETFLVAWRKFSDIPDEVVPWLYRVASYEIANHRRRQLRTDQLHAAMALVQRDVQFSDSGSDLSGEVAAAFASLSSSDQEILRLATWERVTMADGASILGCSVSAYRMRLHRARLRLGKRVKYAQSDSCRDPDVPIAANAFADSVGMRVTGMEAVL
jgi:RNA polymerase sigma-70 factor, ECF subfamily